MKRADTAELRATKSALEIRIDILSRRINRLKASQKFIDENSQRRLKTTTNTFVISRRRQRN